MSTAIVLLSILGALLIGAISPDPSFVLVSRIAAKTSRLDGVMAALGCLRPSISAFAPDRTLPTPVF